MTSSRLSALTMADAVARIGVMSGATSMAPITTAAESASSPNAAMDEESMISAANRVMNSTRALPVGKSSSTAARASSSGSRSRLSRSPWKIRPAGVSSFSESVR